MPWKLTCFAQVPLVRKGLARNESCVTPQAALFPPPHSPHGPQGVMPLGRLAGRRGVCVWGARGVVSREH